MAHLAPPDALRVALGIEAAPVAVEEEQVMDGTEKGTKKAEAAEVSVRSKEGKKAKAATKESKPAKAPAPKKERVENPVVFAFRLSEAERTRIHEAAGGGKASRFVLAAALAAASGDRETFDALTSQAKSNLK
jgi:hypothetical protein